MCFSVVINETREYFLPYGKRSISYIYLPTEKATVQLQVIGAINIILLFFSLCDLDITCVFCQLASYSCPPIKIYFMMAKYIFLTVFHIGSDVLQYYICTNKKNLSN